MINNQPPGMMLYYNDLKPIQESLDYEGLGKLVSVLLEYASTGALPDESVDPTVRMAFGLLRPKLDRDSKKYQDTCEKRRYAVYCREEFKLGLRPGTFEWWKEHMASHDFSVDHSYVTATEKEKEKEALSENEKDTRYHQFQPSPGCRPHYQRLNTPEDDFERRRREAIRRVLEES